MPRLSKQQQRLPHFDLRADREKHEMTQAEYAQLLFTTQSSIARWETDGDAPQIIREYLALYWRHYRKPKTDKTPAK